MGDRGGGGGGGLSLKEDCRVGGEGGYGRGLRVNQDDCQQCLIEKMFILCSCT